jgi:hypothetical protein
VRLVLAALAAAAALVVAELAAGGLGFGGDNVGNPCEPRPALAGSGADRAAQRFVLRGLDLAACQFGESREQLVLDLAKAGVNVGDIVTGLESRAGDVFAWLDAALRRLPKP